MSKPVAVVAVALAVPAAPPASRAAPADWCTAGYEPISGGCLAIPVSAPRASLLIYLHGRYAKDESADESDRQRRVAARFTSNGYAVLALRGKLGACGFAELSDWYCWPSNEQTVDYAGEIVAAWADSLSEAERRLHPDRRFILGFSNGGYFAGLLASRGLVAADGYVIALGGDMLRLDVDLTKAHWPHGRSQSREHAVGGPP